MNTVAICLGIKQWIPPAGNIRPNVSPEMLANYSPVEIKSNEKQIKKSRGLNAIQTRDKNRATIIDLLSTGSVYVVSDICAETGLSRNSVRRHLNLLVNEKIAETSATKYKCAKLNPAQFWRAK